TERGAREQGRLHHNHLVEPFLAQRTRNGGLRGSQSFQHRGVRNDVKRFGRGLRRPEDLLDLLPPVSRTNPRWTLCSVTWTAVPRSGGRTVVGRKRGRPRLAENGRMWTSKAPMFFCSPTVTGTGVQYTPLFLC